MKRILILALGLCAYGSWQASHAEEDAAPPHAYSAGHGYQGQRPFDIEGLLEELRANPEAEFREEGGIIYVSIDSTRTKYSFAGPGLSIYPSVVIQAVVMDEESIFLETTGYTAGDRVQFERWFQGFIEQHKQMQKRFGM